MTGPTNTNRVKTKEILLPDACRGRQIEIDCDYAKSSCT